MENRQKSKLPADEELADQELENISGGAIRHPDQGDASLQDEKTILIPGGGCR